MSDLSALTIEANTNTFVIVPHSKTVPPVRGHVMRSLDDERMAESRNHHIYADVINRLYAPLVFEHTPGRSGLTRRRGFNRIEIL